MDYESQAHHLPHGNSGGKETGEQKNWDVGGFLEKKKLLLLLLLLFIYLFREICVNLSYQH